MNKSSNPNLNSLKVMKPKISHVDSYTKSYVLGIVQKQTTKVYGE